MARIVLENVNFSYPLFGEGHMSLRSRLLRTFNVVPRQERNLPQVAMVHALKDISFELNNGDRLAILGENGSGKTTLLKLVSGIFSPGSGRRTVEGEVYPMLTLGFGMEPEASGMDNIYLMGYLRNRSRRESDDLVPRILDICELGEAIHRPVYTYSSGMAARLAFAITVCGLPEIIAVDEFLGTGDAKFRDKSSSLMREIFEKAGILLFASHSEQLVAKICNKAVLLDQGRVMAFGDIEQVVARRAELCL